MLLKFTITAAFGLLFNFGLCGQPKLTENYSVLFGKDYQKAVQFIKEHKEWEAIIRSQGINPKEVYAIVFPELIRYSSFQDKIETYTLETLYVQYGKAYANFSVGEFQIKPSFAESIEIDFLKLVGRETELLKMKSTDTLITEANRLKRVNRLKDKAAMINYLCMYFKVMNARYPKWKKEEERIKFLASAYNCGYNKPKREIEQFVTKKFFHTGLAITSVNYCYADIAWYFFQQP